MSIENQDDVMLDLFGHDGWRFLMEKIEHWIENEYHNIHQAENMEDFFRRKGKLEILRLVKGFEEQYRRDIEEVKTYVDAL